VKSKGSTTKPRSVEAKKRTRERIQPVLMKPSFTKKFAELFWIAGLLNNGPRGKTPGDPALVQLGEAEHAKLLRHVNLWIDSNRQIGNYGFWQRNGISVDSLRQDMEAAIHVELVVLPKGRAFLKPVSAGLTGMPGKRPDIALHQFATLILDPDYERFERCVECGRFFVITKTFLQKKCAPDCGKAEENQARKERQRRENKRVGLEAARSAVQEYERLPAGQRLQHPSWKSWVSTKIGRSVKWITRNKISPPAN
jgi:hypothetical protein